MNQTYEITLRWGKGYTGKLGVRCWVAAITGTDTQYGLHREFIEADSVEREHFNRARTIINLTYALDEGLYEVCAEGERWYMVVWAAKDGARKAFRASQDRAVAIATLLDDGIEFAAARRATKPAQEGAVSK